MHFGWGLLGSGYFRKLRLKGNYSSSKKEGGKKGKATHPVYNFPGSFSEGEVFLEKSSTFPKHTG